MNSGAQCIKHYCAQCIGQHDVCIDSIIPACMSCDPPSVSATTFHPHVRFLSRYVSCMALLSCTALLKSSACLVSIQMCVRHVALLSCTSQPFWCMCCVLPDMRVLCGPPPAYTVLFYNTRVTQFIFIDMYVLPLSPCTCHRTTSRAWPVECVQRQLPLLCAWWWTCGSSWAACRLYCTSRWGWVWCIGVCWIGVCGMMHWRMWYDAMKNVVWCNAIGCGTTQCSDVTTQ